MPWAMVLKSRILDFWKDATNSLSPLLKVFFWSPAKSSELPSSRIILSSGRIWSRSQLLRGRPAGVSLQLAVLPRRRLD